MSNKNLEKEVDDFDKFISEFQIASFWINHYQDPCRDIFRDGDRQWTYSKELSPDFYERQLEKLLTKIESPFLVSLIKNNLGYYSSIVKQEFDSEMDDLELAYFWISHLREGEIYSNHCNLHKQEDFFIQQSKKAYQEMSNMIPKQMLGEVINHSEHSKAISEAIKEAGNESRIKRNLVFWGDKDYTDLYLDIFAKKLKEKLKKVETY